MNSTDLGTILPTRGAKGLWLQTQLATCEAEIQRGTRMPHDPRPWSSPSLARSSAMVFPPRPLPSHTCLHIQHRPHGQQLGLQELHVLALLASVHLNREPAGLMLEKVHISTSGTDHRPAKIPMLSVATTHNHVIVSPTVHKYASCPRPKQFDPQRASCTGKQWSHMCVTVRRMAKSSWRIGACMQMQTHGGATWACHPHPPTLARRTRGPSPPARR